MADGYATIRYSESRLIPGTFSVSLGTLTMNSAVATITDGAGTKIVDAAVCTVFVPALGTPAASVQAGYPVAPEAQGLVVGQLYSITIKASLTASGRTSPTDEELTRFKVMPDY